MTKKLKFSVGNDNGNSEQDIIIDGKLIRQPNVNCPVDGLPWTEEIVPESLVTNLLDQLIVTVDSPSARPGMYYVGQFALKSGEILDNMQVGIDMKCDVDLPIINTLANISGYAVQKVYEDTNELPESIQVKVDMTTALPVTQHSEESAAKFEQRFMINGQAHKVTVHLGKKRVNVEVIFSYVKAIPEATPVTFSIQKSLDGEWRKDDIFKEFAETNKLEKVTGQYFADKRILHIDIGDGTTEYPVTVGNQFLRQFVHGSNHGAGHAIEEALDEFNRLIHLPDSPRQFFSDVVKQPTHKYHDRAQKTLRLPLDNQAKQIIRNVRNQLTKTRNEIDVLIVYGGGSILMRSVLEPYLKTLCEEREIQLFYIPKEYAVTMNAEGLYIFTKSKIFTALKAKSQQATV
ncbi:ParM/StbA family protein [Brevibacillus agri]|uniref:ParM/StbA family protein n=1 Tax=Brevibacillus agri TaxID=51101 RepID=UPI0018CE9322|nr:ParM/StbA family protein [Brevibacillus agri]MBG9568456.1 hypothetical protein [Brevibacillus agri]